MIRELVKFSFDSVVIYVDVFKVKENFTNAVKVITTPTADDVPGSVGLINLNKVENRFTVDAFLSDGQHLSETYSSAIDKKNGLKTMFGKGNVVVMTWEEVDYNVAIDKYEINYTAKDEDEDKFELGDADVKYSASGSVIYDITITMVVGVDLI